MRCTDVSALGLVALAVVLAGCASTPAPKGSSDDRGCIRRNEINAITPLDDDHILVKLSAARYQLFTVDPPCNGLRKARGITIADAAPRVCGDGTATIAFDYLGVGPTRCRIRRSEPVADKAAALELIEERASREE